MKKARSVVGAMVLVAAAFIGIACTATAPVANELAKVDVTVGEEPLIHEFEKKLATLKELVENPTTDPDVAADAVDALRARLSRDQFNSLWDNRFRLIPVVYETKSDHAAKSFGRYIRWHPFAVTWDKALLRKRIAFVTNEISNNLTL